MVTDTQEVPPPSEPTMATRAAKSTIEWVVVIASALILAFVIKTFFIQAFYIPSASMDPELRIDDRVLVNKLSYRLHDIHRGDIAVFERPECDLTDPSIKDLVKRVVALGGETVEGRDGGVLVDGRPLDEDYLPADQTTADFGPFTVPPGHLWMMGDNRENSKDSRFLCDNQATYIDEDDIVGRAFVRVWPLGSLGGL